MKDNKNGMHEMENAENPWTLLGISEDADETEIRAAYLRQVKAYPPAVYPERAEAYREAYELLNDPLRRAEFRTLRADPEAPLVSLLKGHNSHRSFVGAEAWLKVLKDG